MAVQRLFPGTQCAIGPWTEHGFFYDFDVAGRLTETDLPRILKEMRRLIKADLPFIEEEVSPAEAHRRVEASGSLYKREILDGILARDPGAKLTIWHVGERPSEGGEWEEEEGDKATGGDARGGDGPGGDVRGGDGPGGDARGASDGPAEVAGTGAREGGASRGGAPAPRHWWDLCAGPHVRRTSEIPADAVSLDGVGGAYWRGDESRPQLTRVSGSAWRSRAEREAAAALRAEAARRDHRVLGRQLDLFSIDEATGPGLVLWHPNGAAVRGEIEAFWRRTHQQNGYEFLHTPHVARRALWETSGHADHYAESMFRPLEVDGDQYQLKPMNCPGHVTIYASRPRSHRELPLRWAELGTVYRYERSGALHGLFRVRGFTQDDAHVFCLPEQVRDEIDHALGLVKLVLAEFGFRDPEMVLSTRPESSVGSDADWALAEGALRGALEAVDPGYATDEGGGAFYGPKIDVRIRDALGRRWQCSTVQLDFNLPERFGLEYAAADGAKRRPIMIHRALLGSLERFFGILLEHHAGAFPLWLAPTQVEIVLVSDAFTEYAEGVAERMRDAGLRVRLASGASTPKLVRNAETSKVPLIAVLGGREAETNTLSLRAYGRGQLGVCGLDAFVAEAARAVAERRDFENPDAA